MSGDAFLSPAPDEPLGLSAHPAAPPESLADLRVVRFEFSSRGDRIPGRLLLPREGDAPLPLILLEHGARGSKQADYMDATAGPWARRGAAVASIDLPLHGERADRKLTARLLEAVYSGRAPELVRDFVRQGVLDLRRALDAVAELPRVDATRTAYAAFSLGAIVGASLCAVDPRPRAAALALAGGGFGWRDVDPVDQLGRFAPRPLLLVNATRDATIPRAATEALYEAAGEPKQILWFDATHTSLPGRALKEMWLFLARHLSLD